MKKSTHEHLQRVGILLLSLVLVIGMFAGCSAKENPSVQAEQSAQTEQPAQEQTGTHRDVINIASGEPNTLFPYAATSTNGDNMFDFIYDRLVYTDFHGEFSPRLADSWESNEDGTVITFHLNPNVTWQDGEPFTAQDMVFAAQVATNPETTVTRRSYFASLVGTDSDGVCENAEDLGVIAVDEHTLEYHFKTGVAVSTFLYIDAQRYYPMPYHLLKDIPFSEMETNSGSLLNMGFMFDYSQKPYIILKGVPDFLKELDMEEIIPEIAENFVLCNLSYAIPKSSKSYS